MLSDRTYEPDAPPPPGLVQSLERTVAEAGAADFRLMEVDRKSTRLNSSH